MAKLSEAQTKLLKALDRPDWRLNYSQDWRAWSKSRKQWVTKYTSCIFICCPTSSLRAEFVACSVSQYKALLKSGFIKETWRKEWDSFKFDATYVISEQGRATLESKGE